MPAPENLTTQTPGAPAPAADAEADTNGQAPQQTTTTPETQAAPAFKVQHKGGGVHVVLDAAGNPVGDFKGKKAEAEAELARLIVGGEPLAQAAPPAHTLNDEAPAPAVSSGIDPTTLSQAVLTPDGWLCPEPKREV